MNDVYGVLAVCLLSFRIRFYLNLLRRLPRNGRDIAISTQCAGLPRLSALYKTMGSTCVFCVLAKDAILNPV
jgi:hypothetical protein